jgi:hypothetical protein
MPGSLGHWFLLHPVEALLRRKFGHGAAVARHRQPAHDGRGPATALTEETLAPLRARREEPSELPDLPTAGLQEEVQQRADADAECQ